MNKSEKSFVERVRETMPKWVWFVRRYFGPEGVRIINGFIDSKDEVSLKGVLNEIWFKLPDNIFNIKENPTGWTEFLDLVED